MFVDSVDIFIASGKGGAGAVSFRREKFVIQGGPDGGDGGNGGDVYIEVDNNTDTLSKFRGAKHYKAKNGQPGGARRCHGKRGEDITIKVPLGTQILDFESKELLFDMDSHPMRVCALKGGKGGLGNAHFKNATNQAPTYAQSGLAGQELHIALELKLIADVGLVGYPNVGKSTLISTLSNARPEIANYEFTTLTPHLGVVDVGDYRSFVMADIPGIIDGASEGRGLGLEFLRHIERTKMLLFVLDPTREQGIDSQLAHLRSELERFSSALSARSFGIILSKSDTQDEEATRANLSLLHTLYPSLIESENALLRREDSEFMESIESYEALESRGLESCVDSKDSINLTGALSPHSTHISKHHFKHSSKHAPHCVPYFILPLSSATQSHTQRLKTLLAHTLSCIDKNKA